MTSSVSLRERLLARVQAQLLAPTHDFRRWLGEQKQKQVKQAKQAKQAKQQQQAAQRKFTRWLRSNMRTRFGAAVDNLLDRCVAPDWIPPADFADSIQVAAALKQKELVGASAALFIWPSARLIGTARELAGNGKLRVPRLAPSHQAPALPSVVLNLLRTQTIWREGLVELQQLTELDSSSNSNNTL